MSNHSLWLPSPFVFRRGASGGGSEPPPNPLAPLYGTGAGQIALHLSTAGADPLGGPVESLANAGGSGAALDATVSGSAMPVDGPYLTTGAAHGFPIIATPVDLAAGRLIWVMDAVGMVNLTRFHGHSGHEVRANITAMGLTLQLWSNATGTAVTVNPGTRVPALDRAYLCEVEISGGSARFFIDGQSIGTAPVVWGAFPISRIGRGTGAATPLEGGMGDVLFVNGGTGAAATITAVRDHLNERFALGLTL